MRLFLINRKRLTVKELSLVWLEETATMELQPMLGMEKNFQSWTPDF